jgi:hypothetical protein
MESDLARQAVKMLRTRLDFVPKQFGKLERIHRLQAIVLAGCVAQQSPATTATRSNDFSYTSLLHEVLLSAPKPSET